MSEMLKNWVLSAAYLGNGPVHLGLMAESEWVVLIPHPPAFSYHSDLIYSSSPESIAIRCKMVSNLVSKALRGDTPQVPPRPLGILSISMTLDWGLKIVNWLYQAVSVRLDGSICAVVWRLYVLLKGSLHRCMILLLNVDLPRILLSVP